jgi:hypothetical protein
MAGTDNSLLGYKIWLRADHLPCEPITVLDCYGGYGIVWDCVKRLTKRTDIMRLAIDKEKRRGAVRGDNRKWLEGLDVSAYNIIDLDAYGIPFDQVNTLFTKHFKGTVFFTFIQSGMGMMPTKLLKANGISDPMRKACPTLFGQIGWELWLDWLGLKGVKTVFHRSKDRKHYGGFVLTGNEL